VLEDAYAFLAISTNSTKAEDNVVFGEVHVHGVDLADKILMSPLLLGRRSPDDLVSCEKRVGLHVPVEACRLLNLRERGVLTGSWLADVDVLQRISE
jgi:hypothetical protein